MKTIEYGAIAPPKKVRTFSRANSGTPVVKAPIADKLAFTLNWGCEPFADQHKLTDYVDRRIDKLISGGFCKRAYTKNSRFRLQFYILLDGGSCAHVQICAVDPIRQKGGIRILVNPSRFKEGDANQVTQIMRKVIGREYLELIKRPLINCVDFAVDIDGINLDNVLVNYKNGQGITMFAKRFNAHGHIEGYNFGSVTSDYISAVYSKDIELIHRAVKKLAKFGLDDDPLKTNVIRTIKSLIGGPPTIRVEIRGKKLRGKSLSKLKDISNRFAFFSFVDLNTSAKTKLPPVLRSAVLAMCMQNGIKATLLEFKHKKLARAVNAFLRERQAMWWQPDDMWGNACESLRTIGLFPEEAFE